MKTVSRTDSVNLRFDQLARTPQGGLKIPAFLTRTGIFEYRRLDGSTVREYRPPEEVFAPESIASLEAAPITKGHPTEEVGPRNFRTYTVGYLNGGARRDGDKVSGMVLLQDAEAISAVEGKKLRETSCGYRCDIEESSGTTPDGLPYDRIQRNIRYNHVALVERGRAGSEVRLRLDSDDNLVPESGAPQNPGTKVSTMNPEQIAALMSERELATKRADTAEKALEAETKRADTAEARADTAEEKVKSLEAKVSTLEDPKRLDEAVSKRVSVLTKARAIIGSELKADGVSNRDLMVQAIATRVDGFDGKDRSDDYLEARFDSLEVKLDDTDTVLSAASRAGLGGGPKPTPKPGDTRADEKEPDPYDWKGARDKFRNDSQSAYLQPLAASKASA